MTHSFWTFRKWITIDFGNDRFIKTICDRFLLDCFFKNCGFWKNDRFRKKMLLTIMLTIVNEAHFDLQTMYNIIYLGMFKCITMGFW